MSNKLKIAVDAKAGDGNWFIAGGAAAYWIIADYALTNPGKIDQAYYKEILPTIFPGDVEGNATVQVDMPNFEGKFGPLNITLNAMDKATLDDTIATHCIKVDGINVFSPASIIALYARAGGDAQKTAKRNLRVGLLKCIQNRAHIDRGTVGAQTPKAGASLADQLKARK